MPTSFPGFSPTRQYEAREGEEREPGNEVVSMLKIALNNNTGLLFFGIQLMQKHV